LAALFWPLTLAIFSLVVTAGGRKAIAAWAFISLLLSLSSLLTIYQPMAKKGDWVRVNEWLRRNEQPGQNIVVFNINGALSLRRYYHGPNQITQIPRETPLDKYDAGDYGFHNTGEIAAALARLENSEGRFWLITPGARACYSVEVDLRCDLLEDYVAMRYATERELPFFGAHARLLKKR
ncbi:MAG: hypothetical protein ACKV2V_09565, partial [Blastocatellia bacterium]